MNTLDNTTHIGRKIGRIREMRGMKQEALAIELGVSQQTVSNIEKSATIEDKLLEQVARILGVTSESIKNFSEEAVFNFFNNFHDNSANNGAIYAKEYSFHPIDKLVAVYEENQKLYERLLEAEKSKIIYLEKLLEKK